MVLCPICNVPMECQDERWRCKECPEFKDWWTMEDFDALHRGDVMCILSETERPVDTMKRLRDETTQDEELRELSI